MRQPVAKGAPPPEYGEAPDRVTDRGPEEKASSSSDCRTTNAECKAFGTLQAEFALLGHTLCRTSPTDAPGWFLVTRWGRSRELHGLAAVRSFLRQIGGAA
jgi:hypothetical protein